MLRVNGPIQSSFMRKSPLKQTISFKGGGVSPVEKIAVSKGFGVVDGIINLTQKGLSALAQTNLMKNLTKKINLQAFNKHIMPATSLVFSSCYIGNVLTNDSIEKNRKATLATNMAIVGGLSTALGYFMDDRLKNGVDRFIKKFGAANPDINYKFMSKGIKAAQSIIIFSLIYRLLGPVIATPLADKFSKLFFNKEKPGESGFSTNA